MATPSSSARAGETGRQVVRRPALHTVGAAGTPVDDRSDPRRRSERLSAKERAVLQELARGLSTDEIGVALYVSPHTVRTHVKNGMRKLDARTRAHAVAIALSEGAIELRADA